MKVKLVGNYEEILPGLNLMKEDLGIEIADGGEELTVEKIEKGYKITETCIAYSRKAEFFRAFSFWKDAKGKNKKINISEYARFETVGSMVDMSRNAVFKVDSVKRLLRIHAAMGLNMLMLYTEDTFEIEGEPYFGYMRGAYTKAELQEIDEYADMLGIEVIPCIQTLGHLAHLLKWKCYSDIKDTENVLLADEEKTYEFIEKMIKTCAQNFKTKRIHIGMDEAYGIGTGAYKTKFGDASPLEIILRHLDRVVAIAKKYGLKPLMWNDMFCSQSSPTHDIWDLNMEIPEWILNKKHPDCDLVFWCYHLTKRSEYDKLLEINKKFKGDLWFAGGVETYFGVAPRMSLAKVTVEASLPECKKHGIKNVFCTLWGDDGVEIDYFSAILGIQMYAEHCYSDDFDEETLFENFRICTGCDGQSFMDCGLFDDVPGKDDWSVDMSNISRELFWQDPLIGVFDKNIEDVDLASHYAMVEKKMYDAAAKNKPYSHIFTMFALSAEALKIKADLGKKLRCAYKSGDKHGLKEIKEKDLARLLTCGREIHSMRKKLWYAHSKPFGFEILDIRYAGFCARAETAAERINSYLSGEIEVIDELEQERLPYSRCEIDWGEKYGRCWSYKTMISVM